MQLSTAALNVFAECRRCFYIDRKLKIARPRGIFPSLPGGVDGILKKRLDSFRGSLPPELQGFPLTKGTRLFDDGALLEKYRQWNSKDALKYANGKIGSDGKPDVLVGGLDDILAGVGDCLAPLDYKTKGSEPTQEDCEKYYQRQLDIYALLISTKYDVADFGVLLYFWPIEDGDGLVKFQSKAFFMSVEPARAMVLFEEALALLEGNTVPPAAPDCAHCAYHAKLNAGKL